MSTKVIAGVLVVLAAAASFLSFRSDESVPPLTTPVKQSGFVLRQFGWNKQNVHELSFHSGSLILRAIPVQHYHGLAAPSVIAESRGAVAATNGQYRQPGTVHPKTMTVVDGVVRYPGGIGWLLSISEDGSRAQVTKGHVPDWAYEVFGGMPGVLKDGINTGKQYPYTGTPCRKFIDGCHDASWTNYNPRTVVGVSQGCEDGDLATSCTFYLVTVDGRQPPATTGLRFPQLGWLMKSIGAYDAINLDGGGSTVMWTREVNKDCARVEVVGCLINHVSAGIQGPTGERSVIDAIGVFPSPIPTPSP